MATIRLAPCRRLPLVWRVTVCAGCADGLLGWGGSAGVGEADRQARQRPGRLCHGATGRLWSGRLVHDLWAQNEVLGHGSSWGWRHRLSSGATHSVAAAMSAGPLGPPPPCADAPVIAEPLPCARRFTALSSAKTVSFSVLRAVASCGHTRSLKWPRAPGEGGRALPLQKSSPLLDPVFLIQAPADARLGFQIFSRLECC